MADSPSPPVTPARGFWGHIESFWNTNRPLAWLLVLCAMGSVLWATARPQSPGVSIGLLALAAGIMSVRPQMHPAEKFAWVTILIVFAILEVKAIGRSDKQNEAVRDDQNKQFGEIAAGLRAAITQSQQQFQATMEEIGPTLEASQRAVQQTKPRAYLRYTTLNTNLPLSGFRSGITYQFDSSIANYGTDDGKLLRMLREIDVGLPDDRNDQQRLADKFDSDWRSLARDKIGNVISPGNPNDYRSDEKKFTDDEIKRILAGETVYILRRLEYSDETGIWSSEDCQHLQVIDKTVYVKVTHPCAIFRNTRFRSSLRKSR